MPARGPQVVVASNHRREAATVREMLAQKPRNGGFIELIQTQLGLLHPSREMRDTAQVLTGGVVCVTAAV